MGFFKRISDIVSANLNDMADLFEDPETMLRQATREMEDSISEVTKQTAKAMANEKTLRREHERNQAQVDGWQQRAVTAVEAGDDDFSLEASIAKLFASQVAVDVTRMAMQVHGSFGTMKSLPVERLYRDSKMTEIYVGISEVHRSIIANRLI